MLIFCLLANMTQEHTSFEQTKYEYKILPLDICVLPIYQTFEHHTTYVQHLASKATSRLDFL